MASYRDSVLPLEDVEVLQYRRASRRYSQLIEDVKKVENPEETQRTLSPSEIPAPDGGYGWVIVFCAFMTNLIMDGVALSQGVFVQPILEASNGTITEFSVGWINGCESGVTFLIGPIASIIVNRFGYRTSTIIGTIVGALSTFLSWACAPATPNITYLIMFYGVGLGVGHGLIFGPSIVLVTLYFDKHRALATGLALCGTGMGAFIMSPLSTYLIEKFGWGGALIGQSCILLLCLIFGALLVPPPNQVAANKSSSQRNYKSIPKKLQKMFKNEENFVSQANDVATRRKNSNVAAIGLGIRSPNTDYEEFIGFFTSPTFWIIGLSGALLMLGFFVPFYFLPERAKIITPDRYEQAWLLSAAGIANVIGRIVFGIMSDRPWVNNLALYNTALTIGGIATACSPYITNYYVLLLYCVVFGLGIACFATLRSVLIFEFIGAKKMNNGFGLSLMFMGITSLFGTPLAGFLRDSTEGYELSFILAGVFILMSAVICYPLRCMDAWEKNKQSFDAGKNEFAT